MSTDTITPVSLPLDQARAALEAAERQTDEQFLAEFKDLCQRYSRHLIPEITLRGGGAPVARLALARS